MDNQGIPIPLLVAAGGGGAVAHGRSITIHGRGLFNNSLPKLGSSGHGTYKGAGKFTYFFTKMKVHCIIPDANKVAEVDGTEAQNRKLLEPLY